MRPMKIAVIIAAVLAVTGVAVVLATNGGIEGLGSNSTQQAPADQPKGTLIVRAADQTDPTKKLAGASVTIIQVGGTERFDTSTDANGEAVFSNLPLGKYVISVAKTGYTPLAGPRRVTNTTQPVINEALLRPFPHPLDLEGCDLSVATQLLQVKPGDTATLQVYAYHGAPQTAQVRFEEQVTIVGKGEDPQAGRQSIQLLSPTLYTAEFSPRETVITGTNTVTSALSITFDPAVPPDFYSIGVTAWAMGDLLGCSGSIGVLVEVT